jgi:CRP-like cAMP-binding protein
VGDHAVLSTVFSSHFVREIGSLARRRWRDYSDNERTPTIGKAKAGKDIVIPIGEEIASALKMARVDTEALGLDVGPDAPIFPGCSQKAPNISQEILAEMIGTTRSRVSAFMNKFRKLGLISYNGHIEVYNSLLNAMLHEKPQLKKNKA